MAKVIKSITIDPEVFNEGRSQAKKERRSFSSLVEMLVDAYVNSIKSK